MSEPEKEISPVDAARLSRALDEVTRAELIAAAPNVIDARALLAMPLHERKG